MKSSGSSVWLNLEDIDGILQPRTFQLTGRRETAIPINFAKTLFTYGGIEAMYNGGIIRITENEEEFLSLLEESAEAPNPDEKVEDKDIMDVLKSNNITAMKKLLDGPGGERVRDLVIQHKESLPVAVVKALESRIGMIISND